MAINLQSQKPLIIGLCVVIAIAGILILRSRSQPVADEPTGEAALDDGSAPPKDTPKSSDF